MLASILSHVSLLLIAQADLQLPKGPALIATSDQPIRGAATSRMMLFAGAKPALMSLKASEYANRDLIISELPANVAVGPQSLFYMKDDTSSEFVFTNQSRTHVYYADNSGAYPAVSTKTCGPFTQISDIHITEVTGSASRIIILDKGANTVYSYALTPAGASLCSSGVVISLSEPLWVQSLTQAVPTLYIGYRSSTGLSIRSYNSATLAAITTAEVLSSNSRAKFGKPFFELESTELFVPVMYANDPTNGNDFIVHYNADFDDSTIFSTCRAPTQMFRDFEGADRYRYVYCPSSHLIYVYNTSDVLIKKLSAGANPLGMTVGSDGTDRWVAALQSTPSLTLHSFPADPDVAMNVTTTSITLPAVMNSIGHFAAFDYAVTTSSQGNLISFIDLSGAALDDTIHLPTTVNGLAPQSSSILHFTSAAANSAYSLTELSSSAWRLRTFDVGTYPTKIGYRANRLYVMNQNSDQLSVVNLTSNAVSNLSLEAKPIDFDFDTSLDRLWAVNETAQSITQVDITSGSETVIGSNALGFTPERVLYQSADSPATLYVAGGVKVRSITANDAMPVAATQTLTSKFSDLRPLTSGVAVSSKIGNRISTVTRTTLTDTSLSGTPHFLASNGTIGVAAMQNETELYTTSALSQVTHAFTSAFSNLTNLFLYFESEKRVGIFPFGVMSATSFPSSSVTLNLRPDLTAFDSSGNAWIADKNSLQLQRISSILQRNTIQNLLSNRPEDLSIWAAKARLYVVLRDVNAMAVINLSSGAVTGYSTCESPRRVITDITNSKVFVMCTESNAIGVFTLDGSGDVSSYTMLDGASRPLGMSLNASTSRLYVANSGSNKVKVYNTATNATVATVSVSSKPTDVFANPSNGKAYAVHMNSPNLTTISAVYAATTLDTGILGMTQVTANTATNEIFGLSPSLNSFYYDSTAISYHSSTVYVDQSHAYSLSNSPTFESEFLTYPDDNVVRILEEAGTVTDVQVGNSPLYAYAYDADSKLYVSNFADDTISSIDLDSYAIDATISLTSGCGPTKIISGSISGTVRVYVLCQSNDSVEIITQSSDAVGTPISLRF